MSPALKISLLLVLLLAGCDQRPPEIHYGQDGCAFCRMTIVDNMYATALVTDKGKQYKYDSIECLAASYFVNSKGASASSQLWVTDFENAGTLIPMDSVVLVRALRLPSPMGLSLSAHSDPAVATDVAKLYYGEAVTWAEVVLLVQNEWQL